MERWLDMHMHSDYSVDGEFAPAKLMRLCKAADLRVVALADHNTMRGVDEAMECAQFLGLHYFPAIEIDCVHTGRNFHLLGYGIRRGAAAIEEIAANVHKQELQASAQLLEKVRALGFFFDEKQVQGKARNGVVVAEILAEVILADPRNDAQKLLRPFRKGGNQSDNPFVNFFWTFCAQGKAAYVPMYYVSLATAVYAIHKNGGVAILAHPGANMGRNAAMTGSIIQAGIDGIEAYSNYHDPVTAEFYATLADRQGLLVTAGSDFHGRMKPAIQLGSLEYSRAAETYERMVRLIDERGGEAI